MKKNARVIDRVFFFSLSLFFLSVIHPRINTAHTVTMQPNMMLGKMQQLLGEVFWKKTLRKRVIVGNNKYL